MGLWDLVFLYIVTGISLRWIPTAASAGPSAIVIWGLAWLSFYIPLTSAVVELSSRYPDEGGLYVWSKRAFGPFAGFISAWVYWISNLPYFPAVLYFAASNAIFMGGENWKSLADDKSFFVIFALVGLAVPTVLNIVGLNFGKRLNTIGAAGMALPVLIIVVLGFMTWSRFGAATDFSAANFVPSARLQDLVYWSTVAFAFGGCEAASFMGGEIKNPRRTIPRALFFGGAVVTLTYTMGTFFVLVALPKQEVTYLSGLIAAIGMAAHRLGFEGVVPVAAFLITLSNIAAAGAFLAATARLPFVAGIDRYLPLAFGRVHPRWHTPHIAILTQSICGMFFVLLGQAGTSIKGAYDVLVSIGVITYFIPYLFVFAALIKSQGVPVTSDVIRIPGGKPVATSLALVGFTTTSLAIVLSISPPPDEPNKVLAVAKIVGLTLLMLAIGIVVYLAGKRKVSSQREDSKEAY